MALINFDLALAKGFEGVTLHTGMVVRDTNLDIQQWLVLWEEDGETNVRLKPDGGPRPFLGVIIPTPRFVPDYTDAGTRGHILADLRAAWKDPEVCVYPPSAYKSHPSMWCCVVFPDGAGSERRFDGLTEEEAMLAAWKARPQVKAKMEVL